MRRWGWLTAGLIALAAAWLLRPSEQGSVRERTRSIALPSHTPDATPSTRPADSADAHAPEESDDPYAFTELRGRVIDADDERGIAGAHVRVRGGVAASSEAWSDVEGHFRLRGLGPGAYTFEVEAEGYAPKRHRLWKQPVLEDDEGLELRLERATTVFGRVAGPDDEALEGVVVGLHTVASAVDGHRVVTATGPDGTYELAGVPLSTDHLTAHHPRFGGLHVALDLGAQPRTRVDLRFAPAPTLTGRVLGPSGPLADAWVWLSPPAPSRMTSPDEVRPFATRTDLEGRFVIPSRERHAGLVAWAPGHRSRLHLLQGEREVELELSPSASLRVKVVGRNGAPVPEVTVRVSETDGRGDCVGATDENGEARLVDLAPGEVTVAVQSASGARRMERTTLLPEVENTLEVPFEGGGRITGHAVNLRTGERVTRFTLMLESAGGSLSQVTQSPSGSFALEGVAEGTWTLRLQASDFQRRTLDGLVVRDDELNLGAIELRPLAQVYGRVHPAPGDRLLVGELIDRARNERTPFSIEPDGRFEAKGTGGSLDVEVRDGEDRLLGTAHWTLADGELRRDVVVELHEF